MNLIYFKIFISITQKLFVFAPQHWNYLEKLTLGLLYVLNLEHILLKLIVKKLSLKINVNKASLLPKIVIQDITVRPGKLCSKCLQIQIKFGTQWIQIIRHLYELF